MKCDVQFYNDFKLRHHEVEIKGMRWPNYTHIYRLSRQNKVLTLFLISCLVGLHNIGKRKTFGPRHAMYWYNGSHTQFCGDFLPS